MLQLKQRMFELGYFNSDQFSSKYNDTTAERVRRLQKNNGLTQTGKVTEELWDLIFFRPLRGGGRHRQDFGGSGACCCIR